MRHSTTFELLSVSLVLATGCTAPATDEPSAPEDPGTQPGSPVTGNALNFNALNFNALNFNALSAGALRYDMLAPASAAQLQAPGEEGDLFRMLVRYTTSCALAATQSFAFSWTDGASVVHDESYPGELALAEGWSTSPLGDAGKQMVSACLAARTNYYGIPVQISLRSHELPLRLRGSDAERTEYPYVEGAFWGNLFSASPHVRACYNAATVAHSRAAQRDCAAGHVGVGGAVEPCGIIEILGDCEDICGRLHPPGQYYKECDDPDSGRTRTVITTALP